MHAFKLVVAVLSAVFEAVRLAVKFALSTVQAFRLLVVVANVALIELIFA